MDINLKIAQDIVLAQIASDAGKGIYDGQTEENYKAIADIKVEKLKLEE